MSTTSVDAIRVVAAGGAVIDPKVVEQLVASSSRKAKVPLDFLTPREREVLGEMAQGKSNAAVAASLVLSERAVEKHINSIFSKLHLSEERDVNRRVTAVLMYLTEGDAGNTPDEVAARFSRHAVEVRTMTGSWRFFVMEQAADVVQVLVVDDQAPFRAAARAVVARVQGFELIGEATSGEEAIELVTKMHPAVVLDGHQHGCDGRARGDEDHHDRASRDDGHSRVDVHRGRYAPRCPIMRRGGICQQG